MKLFSPNFQKKRIFEKKDLHSFCVFAIMRFAALV